MIHYITLSFVAILAGSYFIYVLNGFEPRLPTFLAVQTVLIAAPVGFGLVLLGRGLTLLSNEVVRITVGVLVGVGLLFVWRYGGTFPVTVVALLAGLVAHLLSQRLVVITTLVSAMVAFTTWITAVQFANYVILKARIHQLADAHLWAFDAAVYRHILGRTDLTGVFPLVTTPVVLNVLENAYLTLAVQPMVVLLLHVRRVDQLSRFLVAGLASHFFAIMFFLWLPTIGPTLYYPDLFDPSYSTTITGSAITSMLVDVEAVRDGRQPITGFGYFVALPSLHAAIASIVQVATRGHTVFWILLPINGVLLVSTVLLGQHYIVDAIAGVCLGLAMWRSLGRIQVFRKERDTITARNR